MATHSSEPSAFPGRHRSFSRFLAREMWASLAIAVTWLAVVVDALLGQNIVVSNSSGTTSIPSAVVVTIFAYLATRVIARYGLGPGRKTD